MPLYYRGRVARIYWEELLFVGKGMALWTADPLDPVDQYTEVKPGDIGYVDPDGMFVKSMNFWDNRPDPTLIEKNFDVPEPFISRDIDKRDRSMDSCTGHACIEGSVRRSVQSGTQRTVSLELISKYATSFDLGESYESELRHYFEDSQNLDTVLRQTGLPSIDNLVILTGCTLTGDWKAEVHESDTSGPIYRETSPVTNSGHHHPNCQGKVNGSCCNFDGSCCQAQNQRRNQCIFIRAWRVRKRPLFCRNQIDIIRAAEEPKDPDVAESDDTQDSFLFDGDSLESEVTDSEIIVERYPLEAQPPPTYYDEIFDFIFKNSVADMALVHDRHVPQWLAYKRDSTTVLDIVTTINTKLSYFRDPATVFLNPDTPEASSAAI